MYGNEKIADPGCVKSRTHYIISVANCPVLRQSKLQSETALSTMELEVIALAHSYRKSLPIIDLVTYFIDAEGHLKDLTIMHISIHEENDGANILTEKVLPQYKRLLPH